MNYYQYIANLIEGNGYEKIVEVGVWKGELSKVISSLNCVKVLYLIDPFKAELNSFMSYEEAQNQEELNQMYKDVLKIPKAIVMRTTSIEAAKKIGIIDLVFIDANHSYKSVKGDIKAWWPKVREGGLLTGHDYIEGSGVKKAVDEIFGSQEAVERVWVIKR